MIHMMLLLFLKKISWIRFTWIILNKNYHLISRTLITTKSKKSQYSLTWKPKEVSITVKLLSCFSCNFISWKEFYFCLGNLCSCISALWFYGRDFIALMSKDVRGFYVLVIYSSSTPFINSIFYVFFLFCWLSRTNRLN